MATAGYRGRWGADLSACFLADFPDDCFLERLAQGQEAGERRVRLGRPAGLAAEEHAGRRR